MARNKRQQSNLPKLLLKTVGHETLIYDSRSGKDVHYQISETTKHILQYLDQPHKKADLTAKFVQLAPLAIEQEMAFLQERGLLFEEDDRFLSLVLPGEPRRESGLSLSAPSVRKKSELPIIVS